MRDEDPALRVLAERIERLERQNRMLRRALAVLFALVGISLLVHHGMVTGHRHDEPAPPVSSTPLSTVR